MIYPPLKLANPVTLWLPGRFQFGFLCFHLNIHLSSNQQPLSHIGCLGAPCTTSPQLSIIRPPSKSATPVALWIPERPSQRPMIYPPLKSANPVTLRLPGRSQFGFLCFHLNIHLSSNQQPLSHIGCLGAPCTTYPQLSIIRPPSKSATQSSRV